MKITFDNQTLELIPTASGKSYRVTLGDETFEVEILRADAEYGRLDLLITNTQHILPKQSGADTTRTTQHVTAYISSDGAKRWVTINGRTFVLTKSSGARRKSAGQDHASGLAAPMPGQVRSVNVREGEAVAKGQTLMILEAMKMEIRIQSPKDGVVSSISVKVGQTVEREQILINVEG